MLTLENTFPAYCEQQETEPIRLSFLLGTFTVLFSWIQSVVNKANHVSNSILHLLQWEMIYQTNKALTLGNSKW